MVGRSQGRSVMKYYVSCDLEKVRKKAVRTSGTRWDQAETSVCIF